MQRRVGRYTKQETAELLKLYEEGNSVYKICRTINRSQKSIRNNLIRLGKMEGEITPRRYVVKGKDIIIEDITINVASVLPEWIKLIKTNEHKLLPLYPKIFLTMLCKCLQYAADKKENSIFGYVIIRAKK